MKKLLTVILLTAVTITPASAASETKLPVWKQVDKANSVFKLCDGKNLIYRMGSNGSYGKSIFVISGGCK
jgi:hypothetical protein